MANKPEWVDSPKPESSDGTTELLAECLAHCQSIFFSQNANGRYFAHIYMSNDGPSVNRSRNNFRDLLIAVQEVLLP